MYLIPGKNTRFPSIGGRRPDCVVPANPARLRRPIGGTKEGERNHVHFYGIVFVCRQEKNPCSLCAKLRRGALSTELNRLGLNKIALGHHYDDAVETMVMSLFLEGRISCFQPVTYLDRSQVTQIRPLLYVQERDVRGAVRRLGLPVVSNPCPNNGSTKREEMKELLLQLEKQFPHLKKKIFGAIQRYPLYGWSLDEEQW